MKTVIVMILMVFTMIGCSGSPGSHNNPAPSCPGINNVTHHSDSGTLTAPQISLVFWGDAYRDSDFYFYKTQEWNSLANNPVFYSPVSDYDLDPGSFVGSFLEYTSLNNTPLSDEDIDTELNREVFSGELPTPNEHTIYIVLLPPGSPSANDLVTGAGGRHGHLAHEIYSFAVIDWLGDWQESTRVIAHEIYEIMTDYTTGTGWYNPNNGFEIADMCVPNNWELNGVSLPTVWSEAQCRCVP